MLLCDDVFQRLLNLFCLCARGWSIHGRKVHS
uniref:Uncharacterized protein n=1 Tax=Siphoviridae sp. ctzyE57 TaxID=2827982 RepID=A0A8S5SGY4_9CAUD|nr:MAG TPA: hypothetical protein [Siphoviridae sp. ctzyE57]